MKRCPECRAENDDEDLSCAICGAPFDDPGDDSAGDATIDLTEGQTEEIPSPFPAPSEADATAEIPVPPPPTLSMRSGSGAEKPPSDGPPPAGPPPAEPAPSGKDKPERKVARELVTDEAQDIYREDDLQFVPPKKSPFFWVGVVMAAAFGVMVLVILSLWGSGALDGDTCLLIYGFSAPVGIIGLALITVKPSAQRTPVYVALGKGMVLLYFMVVAMAAFFSQTGHIKISVMLQIFAFAMPGLTLGAWLAIYNPHPADLPWYVCVGKGLLGAGMHVIVAATLLYVADIVQWRDIWQIFQGCAAAFGLGSLILVLDVFLTPHPTRG